VRGRRGFGVVVVALWRVCDLEVLLLAYIVGRRVEGRERRVVGCGCCCVARRRAERDIAPAVIVGLFRCGGISTDCSMSRF
jgi:hypothetical protein